MISGPNYGELPAVARFEHRAERPWLFHFGDEM
jgi:hypothetical protein